MKNAKRLVSLLVAVLMIAAIGVAALAAPAPTTYSITLQGTNASADPAQKFKAAKVFDMTYNGDATAYTIASGWENFFAAGGAGAAYIVDTDPSGELNQITVGNATKYINITEANVAEFSIKARQYAETNWSTLPAGGKVEENEITVQTPNTTITVDGAGYWMVYCTTAGYTDTVPGYTTTVTLTNVKPNANAAMKAQPPQTPVKEPVEFDEGMLTDGAQIGDVKQFVVNNSTVALSINEAWHYQVFQDIMGTGFTFNNDLKIRLIPANSPKVPVELNIGSDIKVVNWAVLNPTSGNINTSGFGTFGAVAYNPATNPNSFLLYLDAKALNESTPNYHGYTIELTYSATVNDQATQIVENGLYYADHTPSSSDPSEPLTPSNPVKVSEVKTWVNKVSVNKIIAGTERIGTTAVPAYNFANGSMTENGTVPANTAITLTGTTQQIGGVNYVQITYGTDPNTTTTYIKADAFTGTPLAGAKFVLYRTSYQAVKTNKANVVLYSNYDPETASGTTVAAAQTALEHIGTASVTVFDTNTNPVTETVVNWHKVRYNDNEYFVKAADTGDPELISGVKEYYKLASGKVTWVSDVANATVMTTTTTLTDNVFNGLANGTYYLEETMPPAGYNQLAQPVPVELNGDTEGVNVVLPVANTTAGSLLPNTGGIGTTIFYVLGGILLIGASVLLVTRRRMSAVNN